MRRALAPENMARPSRNSSADAIQSPERTFFVTTRTSRGRKLLQSDRNAGLPIDVLRRYAAAGRFRLRDFVVMPDHIHLLITVGSEIAIERAVQLIKGRFSYRLKKEFGYLGEVWQNGFSETRVEDGQNFKAHREYIAQNPIRAGLACSAGDFPHCFTYLSRMAAGAKAHKRGAMTAWLKPCPDTSL
jgi:putative transposase